MNKDNDFEIIDDFDDLTIEPSSNPVVSNEIPSNEEINKNSEVEIPSFSFGNFETPTVKKEEPVLSPEPILMEQPVNNVPAQEPVTFEFDGFKGVLDNQENIPQASATEVNTFPEVQQSTQEIVSPTTKEVESKEHPSELLAAPGTVNVMPATPTLNMDVKPVPTIQQSDEQPVEINPVLPNGDPVATAKEVKEKVDKNNDKKVGNATKLAFIVILFLIIGAVIIFLPQISSILKEIGI